LHEPNRLRQDLSSARVRRIVTGHDNSGHAVVVEDAELSGVTEDSERTEATFFYLWASREMPVRLTADRAAFSSERMSFGKAA
jgi:hypothetical protein